ncbi:hypothetical protein ACJ72_03566 [Emergomyces africanus]|uniref:DNA mismatch repair protein MutL n=1 Tax=Emergomyces africanus TaxID=1955775 RepID=A0A1B7NZ70_9EURO|nr:hypothetical protein ACJ72_03566 [Emergomyces africanus]
MGRITKYNAPEHRVLRPRTSASYHRDGMNMATIKAIEARSVHQIQSGQVIVDLCSVVKELVENSLDAGATSLDIRFKNNGLDLIEVQDNGKGISPDDYETVALKHYTSKLSKFDDLSSLQTFGFEASKLEFEISGKLKNIQVVAGQKGTTTSVENLFNKLPVRRRELEKNIKREYGKVLGLLHAYACVSTGVRFNVKNQMPKGKSVLVFATQANALTKENISNIYGAKTLLALTPLDLELELQPSVMGRRLIRGGSNEANKIFIHGHISKPVFGEGRQTPDRQMFFVNSRPCGLPQIAKAFNEVYKSFNISQSPFIFADFKMDTNSYDVNVSPDKRTILLHDAGALIESLKTCLTELFERQDQTVPQSQISGKQSTLQRRSGTNIPASLGSGKAAESSVPRQSQELRENDGSDEEGDEQKAMRTFVQRFTGSGTASDEIPETQQDMEAREPRRSPENFSTVNDVVPQPDFPSQEIGDIISSQSRSCESEMPSSTSPPTQLSGKNAESQTSSDFALASSLLRQESLQSVQSISVQHTPNVIQNAFGRMRPSRPPTELATITVGNRTITSTIGRDQSKRKLVTTSFGGSTSRPKRRIHVSSSKSKLGQGLRLFAAPGSQMNEDLENISSGDDQDAVEAKSDFESMPETYDDELDGTPSEQESTHEGEDDTGEHMRGEGMEATENVEPDSEAETSDSDAIYVDEKDKKAREEARVAELIRAAEEKASFPSDDTIHRANKIFRRSVGRTCTVGLVGSINGSLARIQAQMRLLEEELHNMNHISLTSESEATEEPDDLESTETRLSLSVSKEDFAKMRIIGQFNLGFIIATRPQGDPTNPTTLQGHKHDELFIIDQHASDEKYNFERLQAETIVQNQRLVKPKTLDLTAVEEEIIIDNLPLLEKNGFVVEVDRSGDEPIGRRCKLTSLPLSKEVVFNIRDLEELIVLLGESPQMQSAPSPSSGLDSSPSRLSSKYIPRPSKVRKMFAMRACRSSIMIGKTLTTKQMNRVVRHMGMIDKPWNCPHGRPTMRHLMSLGEWNGWDEWQAATQSALEDGEDVGANSRFDVWKRFLQSLNEP